MLLMSATGLTRGFDRGPLFEDVEFELFHGERSLKAGDVLAEVARE